MKALNGSGHSPQKLTIDYARSRGITSRSIPLTDLNSVTVPGAAAAWVDTVEKYGSGKLTIAEVLEPAIRLAEEGYVYQPLLKSNYMPIQVVYSVPVSEIHGFAVSAGFTPII